MTFFQSSESGQRILLSFQVGKTRYILAQNVQGFARDPTVAKPRLRQTGFVKMYRVLPPRFALAPEALENICSYESIFFLRGNTPARPLRLCADSAEARSSVPGRRDAARRDRRGVCAILLHGACVGGARRGAEEGGGGRGGCGESGRGGRGGRGCGRGEEMSGRAVAHAAHRRERRARARGAGRTHQGRLDHDRQGWELGRRAGGEVAGERGAGWRETVGRAHALCVPAMLRRAGSGSSERRAHRNVCERRARGRG